MRKCKTPMGARALYCGIVLAMFLACIVPPTPTAQALRQSQAAMPELSIADVSGAPGDQVAFRVMLTTAGEEITSVDAAINFDSINTPIQGIPARFSSSEVPSCFVHLSITPVDPPFAFT